MTSQDSILVTQSNLANTYSDLGRSEEAMRIRRDVYFGRLKLFGDENGKTLTAAISYAGSLNRLGQFKEARSLLRKTLPKVRRVFGDTHEFAFRTRGIYAEALFREHGATLDDCREAVTTLEDTTQTARRVLGGAHPVVVLIETLLQIARAALHARETPPRRA